MRELIKHMGTAVFVMTMYWLETLNIIKIKVIIQISK